MQVFVGLSSHAILPSSDQSDASSPLLHKRHRLSRSSSRGSNNADGNGDLTEPQRDQVENFYAPFNHELWSRLGLKIDW